MTPIPGDMPDKMTLNPFTLAFSGPCRHLEPIFLPEYNATTLGQMRYSLILGLILYAVFGFLDARIAPDQKEVLWFIRYAVVCPGILLTIAATFVRRAWPHLQLLLVFLMLLTGTGISSMVAVAGSPANLSYYAGVILVFMISYGFLKARFIWATLCGWINIIFYQIIAVFVVETPGLILMNNNFFFISANFIGMITCYSMELYLRRNFFMTLQVASEQQKVIALNQELEERVLERTRDLARINSDLEKEIQAHEQEKKEKKRLEQQLIHAQKMESLGSIAGGIAHDFNNLLFPIMGMSEMLLEDLPEGSPEHESAESILQASRRGSDLVKQILAFSRQSMQTKRAVRFQKVLTEALKLIRAAAPANIAIHEMLDMDCPPVMADPTQLHQVVMNLITNATHAVAGNSGEIFITLERQTRDRDDSSGFSLPAGTYARLEVRDTGTGIDPQILGRIFDPYFTTKEKNKGTGLGLAVVHGIVKEYGGDLRVKSRQGKGSSFTLLLPLTEEASTDPESEKGPLTLGGSEHILLVDDEKPILQMNKALLGRMGYWVTAFSSSTRALEWFKESGQDIDLVLTDMTMPGMTGDLLAVEIKEESPSVPVIICTGYSENMDPDKARALGIDAFLMKPLTMKNLTGKIREVLDRRLN